ncbi:MAG: DUF4214 domain-containing protein [Clostridia bacterium]|nr:DUF4214 domain-containing protein [Clostridia bacterium]
MKKRILTCVLVSLLFIVICAMAGAEQKGSDSNTARLASPVVQVAPGTIQVGERFTVSVIADSRSRYTTLYLYNPEGKYVGFQHLEGTSGDISYCWWPDNCSAGIYTCTLISYGENLPNSDTVSFQLNITEGNRPPAPDVRLSPENPTSDDQIVFVFDRVYEDIVLELYKNGSRYSGWNKTNTDLIEWPSTLKEGEWEAQLSVCSNGIWSYIRKITFTVGATKRYVPIACFEGCTGRTYTISLNYPDLQTTYPINMPEIEDDMLEYSWGFKITDGTHIYEISTCHFKLSNTSSTVAVNMMQTNVWEVKEDGAEVVDDAEVVVRGTTLVWTFTVPEEVDLSRLWVSEAFVQVPGASYFGDEPVNISLEDTPTPTPSKRDLIEAFVTRCYKVILGRAPDAGGLNNWANALESGAQAASNIIDGFVNSQEFLSKHLSNGDAVEILYKAMLDRPSDAGGKAYWVDILSQGNPFGAVINGFCGSQEFMKLCNEYGITPGSVDVVPAGKRAKIEAFVKRCYQIILSRDPDAGGLNNWANALESGAQAASNIIDGFVNSQEFLNKHLSNGDAVEILYRAMLGRESDAAGKANWVNVLNAGWPFGAVINGFCGSQEFTALCNDYGIKPGSVNVNSQVLLAGTDVTEPEEVDAVEPESIDVPEETDNLAAEDAEPSTISAVVVTVPEETVPIELESVEDAEETEAAESKGSEETVTEEKDQIETADTTEENVSEETEDTASETVVEETVDTEEADNIETEVPAEINVIEVPEDEVIEDESVVIDLDESETDEPVNDNITEPAEENVIPEETEEPEAVSEAVSEAAIEPENDSKAREFVNHCYATVLGREADETGLNEYTQQIATGAKSPKQVAFSFVFSNEFQGKHLSNEDIVRVLYRLYLYREADAEGLAAWVAQLDAGVSLEDVVNGFAESAEFTAIINGLK